MERVPQAKDIIRVSEPDMPPMFFGVQTVTDDRIILRNLSTQERVDLEIMDGKWVVAGSNMLYDIEILETVSLTGIESVDSHILLQLDDDVLMQVCKLSTYTRGVVW